VSTVPPELAAVLHGAYTRSIMGEERWEALTKGDPSEMMVSFNWAYLTPGHRKHWEAVAKQAVEFITAEAVSAASYEHDDS
jgi:hypothetical protein